MLNEKGVVVIKDLSKMIKSSVLTIRKDIDILSERGLLIRTHGGAIKENVITEDNYKFSIEQKKNIDEKRSIAEESVKFINLGDVVFLEAGSTCYHIAKNLNNKKSLTVITNSIDNAFIIDQINKNIILILLGGYFNPGPRYLYGDISDNFLKQLNVEKAFIGTDGIDFKFGISESNYIFSMLKKKIIRNSKLVFICADNSKFNVINPFHVCNLDEVDYIITDYNCDDEIISILKKSVKNVIKSKKSNF